jgi:hypothetical protein
MHFHGRADDFVGNAGIFIFFFRHKAPLSEPQITLIAQITLIVIWVIYKSVQISGSDDYEAAHMPCAASDLKTRFNWYKGCLHNNEDAEKEDEEREYRTPFSPNTCSYT